MNVKNSAFVIVGVEHFSELDGHWRQTDSEAKKGDILRFFVMYAAYFCFPLRQLSQTYICVIKMYANVDKKMVKTK